jgi:hypothetical protein
LLTNPSCQFNQHLCRKWDQRFESRRAPGGELAAWNDFVDASIDQRIAAGRYQLDTRTVRKSSNWSSRKFEACPVLRSLLQRHQWLGGDDRLAWRRDEQGDGPVRRRADVQFGHARGNHGNSRRRGLDAGGGDRAFLAGRPEPGSLVPLPRARKARCD